MKNLAPCAIVATVVALISLSFALPVWAWQPTQAETLAYKVSWGPLQVGKAWLTYSPPPQAGGAYTIQVAMKDNTALIDMDSRWTVLGTHSPAPFTPQSYHAVQKENEYRADKWVVFDAAKKEMRYTNVRNKNDKITPQAWDGQLKDVFSQLYALRLGGLEPLKRGKETQVMGTKHPFTLVQQAPVKLTPATPNAPTLWRIPLFSREANGKIGKEKWVVTVREDGGTLLPVKMEAQTKFGVFVATLR